MKRNHIALIGLALALAAVLWSCTRSTPDEVDRAATVSVPIPDQIDELDPALVELIERQLAVVRSAPRDAVAHATLGAIYEANNLWPQARQCYETAHALDPVEPMWAHHAAIAAGTSGDFDGALALLRSGAARYRDFAPIHHRLGDALLKAGAFEEAIGAFKRTTSTAPNHPAGYVGLGDVNLRLKHPEEAIVHLERAVKLAPQDKKASYLLGTAYRDVGRIEEARKLMTLGSDGRTRFISDAWSARLRQYKVSLLFALQTSAEHRASGRLEPALRVLEDAMAFHPDEVDLLTRLGAMYLEVLRTDDALRTFRRADQIDPTNLSTCINLVTCYSRLERFDDALAAADRAVGLGPKVWQAHFNRAVALLRLERWNEARASLEAAQKLSPNNPAILGRLDKLRRQEHP